MLYRFKIFDGLRMKHAFSLRAGGVSDGPFKSLNLGLPAGDDWENVEENYKRFAAAADFDLSKVVLAHQAHTDEVMVIDKALGFGEPVEGVDGFMTNVKGVPLLVRFADCQGVLFFDPVRKVVAAVHCGWRGNAQNILGKTVAKLGREFGCEAGNLLVAISPSLGPCCSEFTDPLKELPEEMHSFVSGKFVDLWECSLQQLLEAGVQSENIEMAKRCTVCENDKFFSYRGGKQVTGHMAAVIQLI